MELSSFFRNYCSFFLACIKIRLCVARFNPNTFYRSLSFNVLNILAAHSEIAYSKMVGALYYHNLNLISKAQIFIYPQTYAMKGFQV